MSGYRTEQKKLLLAYLSLHADEVFTLRAISDTLSACGIGKSTVYRLVSRLVEEGRVRRFAREGGGVAYQYLAGDDCLLHLHLRCTQCGRVTHLSEKESDMIGRTVLGSHRFKLDEGKTLLLGLCEQCLSNEEKEPTHAD